MRVVGFKADVIGWDLREPGERAPCECAWYPIVGRNCEQNEGGNSACHGLFFAYHCGQKRNQNRGKRHDSRIEPYRVSAYNTSKHSENKMHDDTVAKRYGFSGGLVPGVDVMAYMMHLPVAKWGRAFLERGLIEARFVKPVYDGELADVTGEESNGVLAIEVESRGELCATGSASLPAAAPSFSLSDFVEVAAVGERKPVECDVL